MYVGLDERRELCQRCETDLAVLQPDHRIRRDVGDRLLDEMLDALPSQPRGLDAIERRRVAALLDVTEDRPANVEQSLALAFEQRLDELGRVHVVSMFTADHEAEPLAVLEALLQRLEVDLEGVRRRGYAVADNELEPGLMAVAAPITDAEGTVVAAIAVTGPSVRLTGNRIAGVGRLIITETRAISRALDPAERPRNRKVVVA